MNLTWLTLNLLINSACSFAAGLLLVFFVIRFFRVQDSSAKLGLLCLPFVKILWDLSVRGIPARSIALSGINPLTLPPKHQALILSAGLSDFGPILSLAFNARTPAGQEFTTSLGDYIFAWISRHLNESAPGFLLVAILGVSIAFVARRLLTVAAFELRRKKQRSMDRSLERLVLRYRSVDVYASHSYSGSPFTGGFVHPYICFPEDSLARLESSEAEAVLEHEMAHVRRFDLFVTLAIALLGDVLWFVPGYKFLVRRIDRLRELLADQSAVARGISPAHMASSILKLSPLAGPPSVQLYSAFFREPSLVKARVNALVGRRRHGARWGWDRLPVKTVVIALTVCAVMMATFGGNHEISSQQMPRWFEGLLKALGFL